MTTGYGTYWEIGNTIISGEVTMAYLGEAKLGDGVREAVEYAQREATAHLERMEKEQGRKLQELADLNTGITFWRTRLAEYAQFLNG